MCPQTVGETGRTLSGGQVKSTKNFLKIAVFLAGEWEEVTSCTKETLLGEKNLTMEQIGVILTIAKTYKGILGKPSESW